MTGQSVVIREVGPRDGLQSWSAAVPTGDKARLVGALADAGLSRIEATSFVSPRAVPLMADAEALVGLLPRRPGVAIEALVVNERGAERALATAVDALVLVLAASETFNRRNAGASVDDSAAQLLRAHALASAAGRRTLLTIGTAFGCPYEGAVPLDGLHRLIERFAAAAVQEVFLADTTGMAHPAQIERVMTEVAERWPTIAFGVHLHNTRGLGLANAYAALGAGVRRFDASLGGIGGCPFAPQAAGNVCTEDLAHLLAELGYETGVRLDALIETALLAERILGRQLPGQVMRAGPRWKRATP